MENFQEFQNSKNSEAQLQTFQACRDLENHWLHLSESQQDVEMLLTYLLCFPTTPFQKSHSFTS